MTYGFIARPVHRYHVPEGVDIIDSSQAAKPLNIIIDGKAVGPVNCLGTATLSRDLTADESRKFGVYPLAA